MQWVVLVDSSGSSAIARPSSPPKLRPIAVTGALPPLPFSSLPAEASDPADVPADGQSGYGAMYGRYLGQIQARIERAWERPRTAIGAPLFQCRIQVDQDNVGRVQEITLLECNGGARWQVSLVRAIEAASPLPAPSDPAVFAHHVLLAFRAVAYSPGVSTQLYEPPTDVRADAAPRETDSHAENAFQALREAARAPNSGGKVELRIEGSKVEVEPDRQ